MFLSSFFLSFFIYLFIYLSLSLSIYISIYLSLSHILTQPEHHRQQSLHVSHTRHHRHCTLFLPHCCSVLTCCLFSFFFLSFFLLFSFFLSLFHSHTPHTHHTCRGGMCADAVQRYQKCAAVLGGISRKEDMQAVLTSAYSIAHFCVLTRNMRMHKCLSHTRMAILLRSFFCTKYTSPLPLLFWRH